MTTPPTRRARRGRGGQQGHEPRARVRTREGRAMELSVQGWSQHEIAGELGVSQAAVFKILQRVETRVLREVAAVVAHQKARQTLRLEHVYRQALRAWEESKMDATRQRQRKTQLGTGGTGLVAEVVTEPQHGDPRYLEAGRKALADLRKLWGVDAPQRVEVRATRHPFDDMTDEALREELARQERLLRREDARTAEHRMPPTEAPPVDD